MFKEISLLRRSTGRAGDDWAEQFRRACAHASDAMVNRPPPAQKQVLNLPIRSDDPQAVGAAADYDAVIETWLDDSVSAADWAAMPATFFAQSHPAALALVDAARSTSLLVAEVVVGPPQASGYKIISFLWRGASLPGETFYSYWKSHHGPLVKSVPEFWRHVRGYVQNHRVAAARSLAAGSADSYDGITQLWFDSDSEAVRAFSEPRYLAVIRPDELILRSGPPHRLSAQEIALFAR